MSIKREGRCVVAGLSTMFCMLPGSAHAVLELTPFISAGVEHDSNVFRFEDGDEAFEQRGERKRADTLMAYRGGVTGNYSAGLQKLKLDASLGKYEYDHFSELDYKGHKVDGILDWQLGSLLTGTAKVSDSRDLQGFETVADAVDRSLRDQTDASLVAKLRVFQDWEVRPRGRIARARYSLDTTRQQDLNEDEVALALSYLGRGSLTVGLEGVFTDGDFIRRDENSTDGVEKYEQKTLQLVGRWQPSPVSSLDYTIGATERDNEGLDAKDDDAVVGSLGITRNLSEKTSLFGGASRAIYSAQREGESTVISTGLRAGAYWAATPYVTVNAYGYHQWETFKDSTLSESENGDRKEKVKGLILSLIYAPRPWINLTPGINWADRTSELSSEEYDSFRASFEVKLLYPVK